MRTLIFCCLSIFLLLLICESQAQWDRDRPLVGGRPVIVPIETMKHDEQCDPAKPCSPGLVLPVWQPQEGISTCTRIFRAFVYLIAMLYLFLGVSIVADRFMAAIEVITSQEREVKLKKPTGEPYVVLVRIWNETVSNLTLMALGSSAPEILLSIIEIFGNNFEAGDLGPSTIVGSAAFNFFLIIAICIVVIPNNEIRRIDRIDVFWITAVWATFAYIWLYLILCVFSPDVVEVWEGVLTFSFFFLTVISAYIANRYAPTFGKRFLGPATTKFTAREPAVKMSRYGDGYPKDEVKLEAAAATDQEDALLPPSDPAVAAFEEHKHHFWEEFQRLRSEHPDLTIQELGKLAAFKALSEAPRSRAVRRLEAIRWLTGGFLFSKEAQEKTDDMVKPLVEEKQRRAIVSFSPCHYICMENVGIIKLTVACDRGALEEPTVVTVHYKTIEGSAKEHTDFVPVTGVITFQPYENLKEIGIKIVDRPEYEHDEDFEVHLYNPKAVSASDHTQEHPAAVGAASSATVIIVDDDHGGAFSFESEVFKVNRTRGARGRITIPYTVTEGRAKQGMDFNLKDGELQFLDGQTSAEIRIEIINDNRYEKNEDFYIELGEPVWHTPAPAGEDGADGRPVLGEHKRCKILIIEDQQFKHFVDKLIAKTNLSIMVGTSSWKQQFEEAWSPVGADEPDQPSGVQKFMHYLTLPWKLLFACIPPTDYAHGWVCFCVAIFMIGLLTAIIGDVASHFGCTIGLKDSVTAITLVAVGTSVPDTFASKIASVQDKTADSSIGNVTGSNAVNVFLGIGVAWAIAAIYHAYNGTVFRVQAGSLASSVALFLIGSVICIGILQFRRYRKCIGGELGGPVGFKYATGGIFVLVWVVYIVYCSLDAYCLLPNIGS